MEDSAASPDFYQLHGVSFFLQGSSPAISPPVKSLLAPFRLPKMKTFAAISLLGAAALVAADKAQEPIVAPSNVHDLKTDTFKPFIAENDLVLAEFFAPWCGHCKALAPEYEEAATALKDQGIQLAKVDCTEEAGLCKEQGVEGYPTLKIFRKGNLDESTTYPGQRKAPAIISYMTKQSLPAVSILDSNTIEGFKTQDKVVVVAYIAADDNTSNTTFTSVANALRDNFLFGASNDKALAEKESVKQPSVVLYKSFDEGKDTFTEKIEVESLSSFIKTSATPLVGEVGPETYEGYMNAGLPLLYVFAEKPKEREDLAKELTEVAKKYKGKVSIATIDAESFGQHAGNLNLEVGKWPAVAIQEIKKSQKFPMSQEEKVNANTVEKFVADFVAGKIEASIKSEPIPESNDGPVTIVVAKNYNDIVLDDKKDVLIEFYAPWCGHCKSLAPKYEELGTLFGPHKDKIVIAKVDATANDVPDEIQGFPTIKLYSAGKKATPENYGGSRTIEDLATFVRDNGSHKIDILDKIKAEDRDKKAKDGDSKDETAEDADLEFDEDDEDSDVDDEDIMAKITDAMPEQAAAASEKAEETVKGAAAKVAEKVKGAAQAVLDIVDDEGGVPDHGEL